MELMIGLVSVVAGLVQGITGFGSGIVLMMLLPIMYALPQAAGISIAICVFLNASMVLTYRKHVNFKKIIPPALLYVVICFFAMRFSTSVDQHLMKKIFGLFLLLLSVYYLFIAKNTKTEKFSLGISILFIFISALCDVFFGIGGPLMVLYFMSQTKEKQEYLGTITAFFLINGIYNTILRLINGILSMEYMLVILYGIVGIVLGGYLGKRVVNRIDSELLKKIVYVTIGLCGILNLIS
ncbi:MAG: sulfite exporter TauE/SafE family protein [Bacillota bacterium]|nr:sulfite exporter TauE/SafE family protein [Bacillota bacterium]